MYILFSFLCIKSESIMVLLFSSADISQHTDLFLFFFLLFHFIHNPSGSEYYQFIDIH